MGNIGVGATMMCGYFFTQTHGVCDAGGLIIVE